MKTRILYPVMLFAALAGFTSCSKDDDTVMPAQPSAEQLAQSQSFFNLKVGSEWTYKRYENSEARPDVLTFSGDTDRVTVESTVDANGLTFSKLKHTITNPADSDVYTTYEYTRVNAAGHLVSIYSEKDNDAIVASATEKSGVLVHPGVDAAYTAAVKNPSGTMSYKVSAPTSITVEGKSYTVTPYSGVFTPSQAGLTAKTVTTDYAQNVGLVRTVRKELNSNYTYEDRLVSYNLAP